ncbi:MAG: hypothetical protein JXJ20_08920 [Anaerolineae bacterium]|jgi:hypothetical protein|nr:hypothetical protein [Anaerolineae bacterium]
MRKAFWAAWAVLALLLAAALACSFNFSTAHFESAIMTSDSAGENKTTTYGTADTFYCIVELANAPDDTTTKAVWKTVEVEGQEPDTVLGEYKIESGNGTITFEFSPETEWPVGTYKVELYLDGDEEETLEFTVQ